MDFDSAVAAVAGARGRGAESLRSCGGYSLLGFAAAVDPDVAVPVWGHSKSNPTLNPGG